MSRRWPSRARRHLGAATLLTGAARLSDCACPARVGDAARRLLADAARDQPHRHDSAHPAAERGDRPRREFRESGARATGPYEGRRFNDTDVYKAIEAASYTLVSTPTRRSIVSSIELIALIAAAQEPDGYLFPARTIDPEQSRARRRARALGAPQRQSRALQRRPPLRSGRRAFPGDRQALAARRRDQERQPRPRRCSARRAAARCPGIRRSSSRWSVSPTRPATARYATWRGSFSTSADAPHEIEPYPDGPFAMYNDREYRQDHRPVVDQDRAVGHAVRATYMYAGMTDIAALVRRAALSPGRSNACTTTSSSQAPVRDRRHRRAQRHRIVRRRLRAAQSHAPTPRRARRSVSSSGRSRMFRLHGRRAVSRPRGAGALQRRAVGRLGLGRSILLPEPAGLRRQGRRAAPTSTSPAARPTSRARWRSCRD